MTIPNRKAEAEDGHAGTVPTMKHLAIFDALQQTLGVHQALYAFPGCSY